jgi:extracellular factor (EF) 3-hydroxypalmitic acid methyl ester biosynthesis protein
MSFLERLSEPQRDALQSIAQRVDLSDGDYLTRRGEPGGDLFLLVTGSLLVVNGKIMNEEIIHTFPEGALVGELTFLDESPRTADVRASGDCLILRWARIDIKRLLDRESKLAADFYRHLAGLVSARMRQLDSQAREGVVYTQASQSAVEFAGIDKELRAITDVFKTGMFEVERRLQRGSLDDESRVAFDGLMDELQEAIERLMMDHSSVEAGLEITETLGRELHPYLVRSHLAERCVRRSHSSTSFVEIMSHVLGNRASGTDALGTQLDRWILERPTLEAIRSFHGPIVEFVKQRLPVNRNRRVLLVNAGTGSLGARLQLELGRAPMQLTVLDQSQEAFSVLDAGRAAGSRDPEISTIQQNLVSFAMGRVSHRIPRQDAVILHGLLEYLPDRLVASLLSQARELIGDRGVVVVSALGTCPDHALMDRLLHWPIIRRSPESLLRLFEAAHLDVYEKNETPVPAMVFAGVPVEAKVPTNRMKRSS